MQILDRDVSPALERLYQEVIDLRPDAEIRFTRGVQAGGTSQGWHQGDTRGNSEILLTPDYDDFTLAHELLHALIYRRGFPYATVLIGNEGEYGGIVETISCCVTHPSLQEEVRKHGLDDLWREGTLKAASWQGEIEGAISDDSLGWALWLSDAMEFDPDAVAKQVERCKTENPETWAVVEKLRAEMERCRSYSAMRWRRSMIELLTYFDAGYKREHPEEMLPSQVIMVSLVMTEPQLTRPAERMFEPVTLKQNIIGFSHKQDRSIFHLYYVPPGQQKKDLIAIKDSLKRYKAEPWLDAYQVPYSVDLKAAPAKG